MVADPSPPPPQPAPTGASWTTLSRHEWGGAVLGCAVLVTLFFAPALFTGRIVSTSDLLYQYYPWRAERPSTWTGPANPLPADPPQVFEPWLGYAAARIRAGTLPLWNPNAYLGAPFLGNSQAAVLYPAHWLYYLWPDPAGLVLRPWLLMFGAALGTYALARSVGQVRPLAAALAVPVFAFGGFLTVWALYSLAETAMWLPWLWWATAGLLAAPGRRAAALLAGIAALSVFAGHPETTYHNALATGVFALFYAAHLGLVRRPRLLLARLGGWTAAYGLGAALAAIQVLPFLEYLTRSAMWSTRAAPDAVSPWLPFHFAWVAMAGDLFGNPARGTWWAPRINYIEISNYNGVLPLLLAPAALLAARGAARRWAVFLLAFALVCLGTVYRWPIIFEAVSAVPLMRLAANQRLLLPFQLALALLAAAGLEALLRHATAGGAARRRALLTVGGTLALALLGGIVFPWLTGPALFGVPAAPDPGVAVWERGLLTGAGLLLVGGGLLAGVLLGRGRVRQVALGALPVLLVGDLLAAHADFNPAIPRASYFPSSAAIRFLQAQPGLWRLTALRETLLPNTALVYGLADMRGYDALEPQLYHDLTPPIEPTRRVKPGGSPVFLRRLDSPLVNLMNVRYVLLAPGETLPPRYVQVFDGGATGASVYENTAALPRAWLVHQALVEPDPEARVARLADPAFPVTQTALLTAPLAADQPLPAAPPPAADDQVTIPDYRAEQVQITTRSPAAALLILADQAYPGWTAQVDGQPAPILTADHALRAVYLPAGDHTVRFTYQPVSFTAGAAISGGAALLLLGLVLWPRRRTRTQKEEVRGS